MINFYRRFIPHAMNNQQHLNALIVGNKKKDRTSLIWDDRSKYHFQKCKDDLANATLLAHPAPSASIMLCTDASDSAMGAVVHQIVDGEPQPIAFFSRKFSPAQCKYSTYDRELLAIYTAIKYFRHLLEGREFTIATDHKPLTFAFTQKKTTHHLDRFDI